MFEVSKPDFYVKNIFFENYLEVDENTFQINGSLLLFFDIEPNVELNDLNGIYCQAPQNKNKHYDNS